MSIFTQLPIESIADLLFEVKRMIGIYVNNFTLLLIFYNLYFIIYIRQPYIYFNKILKASSPL